MVKRYFGRSESGNLIEDRDGVFVKYTDYEALKNLVDYHLKREPVIDQAIYRIRSIQTFALDFLKLVN